MAKTKGTPKENPKKMRPALTPEAEEKQMISLAMDAAREQLENGTASSQLICHFLKLATTKEKQEVENLKKDLELKQAKIDSLETSKHIEELYVDAIRAMKRYQGNNSND